ncbi:MAG: cob(I)yrinic acid a,c-diamide adenosyltransferase [Anaerolineales bacterium]|nr:cob(I)yrinic acid a,c-diamide adenosyltransferase [Anaerolineales bacterium]
MSKFYTQTGDDGYTGRLGKGRLPKYHILIETVGTIDEASAVLGLARAQTQAADTAEVILQIQKDLYHIMAELSATKENASKFRVIDAARLAWLESEIDRYSSSIDTPAQFIVPGDSISGAALAFARTIVRRSERRVAELHQEEEFESSAILPYLNRLSSLCFVLELKENQSTGLAGPTLAKDEL